MNRGSKDLKNRRSATRSTALLPAKATRLLGDIRNLIESARGRAAQAVNTELVMLYWHIGTRIRRDIIGAGRAAYGEQIVDALSRQLSVEYGRGVQSPQPFQYDPLCRGFSDEKIVQALSAQLSWTHLCRIIYLDNALEREFYAEMCRIERWSTRTLAEKIQGMLYQRTAISRKPEQLIRRELAALRQEDRLTPDLVFRDPYLLDFLGLADTYSEQDLENAILHELERFLLEIGTDFAFLARQKRITVDNEDYYLDLLFLHRRLRCLVVIDLKLGKFQAGDKGQMELYLRWLDENERQPGEAPPIGLILCAGKSTEHVKLLRLAESGIRVAEYLTELPPRNVLASKLHEAIRTARAQMRLPRDSGQRPR